MGGAKACIADTQIGLIPGMLISRLASSFSRARPDSPLQLQDLRFEAGDLPEQNPAQFANRLR